MIYFYEKPDGEVFAAEEAEAAKAHNKFTQIGASDGSEYMRLAAQAEGDGDKLREAFKAELERARGNFQKPTTLRGKEGTKDVIYKQI